jgi:beta-galactosidase
MNILRKSNLAFGARGIASAALCMALLYATGAVFAAYVPEPTNRADLNFSTNWLYKIGNVTGAQAANFSDNAWSQVCLPHTMRLEKRVCSINHYMGIGWYRRHFYLPASFQGKKVFVEFEGAMKIATVYCNGDSITTHYGGYIGFTIDLTSHVNFGDAGNVIAVKVDNGDNYPDVPPGTPESLLDFCCFGGLYRNAHMHVTDKTHITDALFANKVADGGIFVTYSNVGTASATVSIKTNVINENTSAKTISVKSTIVDSNGQAVATATSTPQSIAASADYTFSQTITVTNPQLWHPDHPNMYTLYTAINDGSAYIDNYTTRIGIRTINFNKSTLVFTINGQPLRFEGTNRHQEFPYVGYAASNSMQARDVMLLKEGGNQWVRSSHYAQAQSYLDACDKYGLMVMDCLPGWQFFQNDTVFINRCYRNMREMVRRDRNHPSVFVWEANLNETTDPNSFAQSCQDICHAEYPGDQMFTFSLSSIFDVPQIMREYGDFSHGYNTSTSRCDRFEGEVKMLVGVFNRMGDQNGSDGNKSNYGLGTWCGIDYNRGYLPDMCKAGLVDLLRLPKFVYYYYQAQRHPNAVIPGIKCGHMVKIANYWTAASPRDTTFTVTEDGNGVVQKQLTFSVYSTCDSVRLFRNDTLISKQGPTSKYPNVPKAPFYFSGMTYKPGTLRADGLVGGVVMASDTVRTPQAPKYITVTLDTRGIDMVADGSDLVFAYAAIHDTNGTIVPTANNQITFSVSGPASIVGDASIGANPVNAEAGIIAVLVQSALNQPGTITVTASAAGLASGTATITSKALTETTVPVSPVGVIPGGNAKMSGNAKSAIRFFVERNALIVEGGAHIAVVSIIDLSGKTVLDNTVSAGAIGHISTRTLKAGVYSVRISSEGSRTMLQKIVVLHH